MKVHQIGNRTFADTSGEGRGNIGAIELQNYTVIIDSTLFPSTATTFRQSLETQIKSPIRKLVLTHYHADHVFGNQVFKDCEIISSVQLLHRMEEQARTFELRASDLKERPELAELKRLEMTLPTMTFEKTMSLRDGDFVIEITRVGGHTEGSSFVYFPQERILFSGDLIFAKEFPWAGDATCDPQEWMSALNLFKELDVETIVPGHGSICDKREIDKYLEFFEETTAVIRDLIDKGFTKREVLQYQDFPSFYTYERRKGAHERRSETFARWYDFYKQGSKE
ncbi:MAG: MBL fold metallo-hydrolase [Candidatus Bathyarchaeota archaeon]|nr:MBL fold metallo-hydrolase [Candidatus Bathyarchaeota archaeon]